MKTVKEFSSLTGVSVRTLHYYDSIGLLKPEQLSDAGYRLYGTASLERLRQILFFRELDFPLEKIQRILDDPHFDRKKAMEEHIRLLCLQRERLDRLIALAGKEVKEMDLKVFQKEELEAYKKEAQKRWGHTEEYKESLKKEKAGDPEAAVKELMDCFARFGALLSEDPASEAAQNEVQRLQDCISKNYYKCTKPVLASLGQMYTQDERFKKNIDRMGGEGTAEFAAKAIGIYCRLP